MGTFLNFSFRIFLEFKGDFHPSTLSQVKHLLKSNCVHVFNMLESSQHFKGKVFKRIILQYGTHIENFFFKVWIIFHQLIFVEEINEVTERIDSSSSSYKYDFSRLCSWQLKSLSFWLTNDYFFNRSRTIYNSLSEFSTWVCPEHYGNRTRFKVWLYLHFFSHFQVTLYRRLIFHKSILSIVMFFL